MVAVLIPRHASAQTKTSVYVSCNNLADDFVGARFCTSIRDEVAKSPRYSLLDSVPKTWHDTIRVTTVSETSTSSTAGAVVLTLDGPNTSYYLTHFGFMVSSTPVDEEAANIIASIDATITDLLK
jgi:hypothetical protein